MAYGPGAAIYLLCDSVFLVIAQRAWVRRTAGLLPFQHLTQQQVVQGESAFCMVDHTFHSYCLSGTHSPQGSFLETSATPGFPSIL